MKRIFQGWGKNLVLTSILLSILIASMIVVVFPIIAEDQTTTTLTVTASNLNPAVGETFEVYINVSDVTDLFSWQILLVFRKTCLAALNVEEGDFLKQGGGTYFPSPVIENNYNATHGYIFASSTLLAGTGVSGSGLLLTVTFNGTRDGISELVLDSSGRIYGYKTLLLDSNLEDIPFQPIHSSVTIGTPPPPPPPSLLYVSPSRVVNPELTPCNLFNINVSISQATDISMIDLKLGFDPTIIKANEASPGDIIPSEAPSTIEINNESGYIHFYVSLESYEPINGNGTLLEVVFHVEDLGESTLPIYEVSLTDSQGLPVEYNVEDGFFSNILITKLSVEPPEIIDPSLTPPATFNVNVTIDDVENMYGYSFNMSYDPSILTCLSARINTVFNETNFTPKIFIDDEYGFVWVKVTYKLPANPITSYEPLVLVTITFQVDSLGATDLDLHDTHIIDENGQEIYHETYDGYFCTLIRDVAVIEVVPFSNETYTDWILYVNVTVRNEGNLTETFDITLYYDDTPIETLTVNDLEPNMEFTITFEWHTTGVAPCQTYNISATAHPVTYETDLTDNIGYGGAVKVKMLGDINSDGVIDIRDVAEVGRAFASYTGHPRWNPQADLNLDGYVDIRDIALVGRNFGKTC